VPTVVPAEGIILERRCDAALKKTEWGRGHQRQFALVERGHVLASAQRYDLTAVLDRQSVNVCGIGGVFADPTHGSGSHAELLVAQLLDEAGRNGAGMALLFSTTNATSAAPDGFDVVPTMDVELRVAESPRHGAPMTLVRGGDDRDVAAIVEMGRVRAGPFRLHLDRDVDLVKYAITRNRLLAGLGPAGGRQLQFVIAEEGATAAAYVVISVVGRSWTIEECGDRDASGARVGAILQALIAREPAEERPVIRGWLPPGFVPPQVTIVSAIPSTDVVRGCSLTPGAAQLRLSSDDVLYWRSDFF
jgi:hypothetical protein